MVGGVTAPPLPDMPSYWDVSFATADIDAAATRVAELGGTVVVGPLTIPIGRVAQVLDPQGATFSLFAPGGG